MTKEIRGALTLYLEELGCNIHIHPDTNTQRSIIVFNYHNRQYHISLNNDTLKIYGSVYKYADTTNTIDLNNPDSLQRIQEFLEEFDQFDGWIHQRNRKTGT